jgi:deoxyadenosine/deoxycytidine kinase
MTGKIGELEVRWREAVYRANSNDGDRALVVSVCGPSGSGKTTVVNSLSRNYSRFVESTDGNPYLEHVDARSKANASANQQWFLSRIGEFIRCAKPERPLVLDQDPAAVVLVYSRMFRDTGLIDDDDYHRLLSDLLKVEETLSQWKTPRTTVFLDAPAKVLRERVLQRSLGAAPSLKWFATVRRYFLELSAELPNVVVVPTAGAIPQQISSRVAEVLGTK